MDNLSLSDIASVTRNNDDCWGGGMGFFWIFARLLLPMLSGGGLWGNNAASTADIQRAVDLNSIQQGQAGIAADVQRGIYEINGATKDAAYNNLGEIRDVGTAVSSNSANIINNLTQLASNMQTCCCETKQTILENRYLDQQNTSQLQMALMQSEANTTDKFQKIMDKMNEDKIESLQNQINALNLQNAVAGVVRYPTATTYTSGSNPFCATGCGCF